MKLHELTPAPGAIKAGFRVGRGIGSGNGKTSGKGHKGQKARSGYSRSYAFEGGQMPLVRRLPKRGFVNIFAKPLTAVNLSALDAFENGQTVTLEALLEKGIVRSCPHGLKVLGKGELSKKLTVQAHAFSESARAKIESAGGKAEVV